MESKVTIPDGTERNNPGTASCFPTKEQKGRVKQVCATVREGRKGSDLEVLLFGLSRKLLTLNAVVKRNIEGLGGTIHRRSEKGLQPTPLATQLLHSCVAELVAISKLPDSPLSEITPEVLADYDSVFSSEVSENSPPMSYPSFAARLPRREREVVQYLAVGKSNKEIAVALGLSVKTIETYRARIMLKLNAHSVSDLVRYAIRNKLVEV